RLHHPDRGHGLFGHAVPARLLGAARPQCRGARAGAGVHRVRGAGQHSRLWRAARAAHRDSGDRGPRAAGLRGGARPGAVLHAGHTELATRYLNAPMVGIVARVHPHALAEALKYVVGGLGTLTLVAAANSAMLGLSRLAYSLSTNRQIPSGLGRLHPQRSTPFVLIMLAGLIAAALVVPED